MKCLEMGNQQDRKEIRGWQWELVLTVYKYEKSYWALQ